MAETVKKSRIVSEDDLEESLMQEFNMRLKTCMSSDKLNDEDEENQYENIAITVTDAHEENHYENVEQQEEENHYVHVEVVRTNGNKQEMDEEEDEVENEPLNLRNKLNSIEEFLQIERECMKMEQMENNVLREEYAEEEEMEDENLEICVNVEEVVSSPENMERVSDSPQSESFDLPQIENSEVVEEDDLPEVLNVESLELESKSVKDRMFLSTDSASCLLFTQTVTSPMLTPSEERIDFIKGFQNESPQSSEKTENSIEEKSENNNIQSVDLLRDVPNGHEEQEELEEEEKETETEELVPIVNAKQKYMESVNRCEEVVKESKVTECKIPSVKSLKSQYIMTASSDTVKTATTMEKNEFSSLKSLDIMKQISKFEQISPGKEENTNLTCSSTETMETSSYVETTTTKTMETKSTGGGQTVSVVGGGGGDTKSLKKKKSKKSRSHEKENISVDDCCDCSADEGFYNVNVKNLRDRFNSSTRTTNHLSLDRSKSSFSKFDALQKKNVLHVRSTDSSKAQEKFNGNQIEGSNCKSCGKQVFQMEQMKAEKCIWHKNCFRCNECNKQLTVDTYQSHEGTLYCKPHFKALFAPKAVEDDTPQRPRKHEMIIRENQPQELPPDVVRASDKPDLGLEELQSLNVKERFQVFEHHQEDEMNQLERTSSNVNVKRSPSILSKLARFQAKGMDIGVNDESLNGIPIEESSSEEEEEVEEIDGEDADLIRAKRAQKEKPFHFVGMSDVKSKWEQGDQNGRDERREERKQEIQSIRNRLFMGKQGKMKEAYQQAVMDSEMGANVKKTETIEVTDTRSLKERFEKGQLQSADSKDKQDEDMSVFESGISKKSRSIFLELDANAAKAPQMSPLSPTKSTNKHVLMARQVSEDVVKSTQTVEDVTVQTADIQQRFKFFETYREPEQKRRQFRITPPREGQVKDESPDREVYRDPDVVRSEEAVEDSVVAKQTQTAKKMLNKFRQMEEDLSKDHVPLGPKPLKRFTPPPEPVRSESESEEEYGSESGEEEESEGDDVDHKLRDEDLLEAQKAARAKQLRAKFEKWEVNEIKREQNMSSVNIAEELGEEQSQIESTKSLRARFESMKESGKDESKSPRVKVNRFVDTTSALEYCQDCKMKVYPLEKISVHGAIYHKKCFKCMECNTILRMDSYSYNQGLLYCTPHFRRLFITKGNYDTAFGLEQHKEKWNASVA